MSTILGRLRKSIFGIPASEAAFSRRGFRSRDPAMQARLERLGQVFIAGYHAALERAQPESMLTVLLSFPRELRGFAFEGAAMGLALQDWLTPWVRNRVRAFLKGPGFPHIYMVHVGAGWAMARMPGSLERFMARFDPLLCWLLVDGYGFHEAFFHGRAHLENKRIPGRVRGYARHVFYQGFGRGLWFVEGGDCEWISEAVGRIPKAYHPDLWSGVGLAAVYAGELPGSGLIALREAAGPFFPQLAQGAAFAAKARERAGNLTDYQHQACEIICGRNAILAAGLADEMLENLPFDRELPAYEIWRSRIQQKLSAPVKLTI
jgi:hypothetical protein